MSKKKDNRKDNPNAFLTPPDGFDPRLWNRLIDRGHVFEMVNLELDIAKEQDRIYSPWNQIALALYEGYITAIGDITEFLGGEPGYLPNPALFVRTPERTPSQPSPELWPVAHVETR